MTEELLIRTTVRLPKRLHIDLKKEASERGSTIEELVRIAVERELSSPLPDRFIEPTQGNERRLLRELERDLQSQLEKIRTTLASSHSKGHEILMELADRFLECLPVPILIREFDGEFTWKNPAFSDTLNETFEKKNIDELDKPARGHGSVLVRLHAKEVANAQAIVGFDSLQFTFKDADGKLFTGDLLMPHASVQNALRGQAALMPIIRPPSQQTYLSAPQDMSKRACQAAFLEALPISSVIKDLGGRYQWANTAMLNELGSEKSWEDIIGKRLVEWWSPNAESHALAREVDEQEELVKTKKIGYLVPTHVNDDISRIGLRFPLLDAQQRVTYVGTIAVGQPILFAGSESDQSEKKTG